MNDETTKYVQHMNILFESLQLIDIESLVDECKDEWYNQTLCKVNDSVVRLGILHGEYHWHKHDREDEFFFTLTGKLLLDIEGKGSIELNQNQGYVVPGGIVHRTRAPEKVVILMVETAEIEPKGDK
jgi:mannose-6-phosphate isomerase-like protein (cupin superfamily)